jgi:hypothetical protein
LTDPDLVDINFIDSEWDPWKLLEEVAKVEGACALIDTGALITGLSNQQTAEYLLEGSKSKDFKGLRQKGFKGVCFLNTQDQKMVLLTSGAVVPLEESFAIG